MNRDRLSRALDRASALGLEALVLMPGPNLFYLTGLQMHVSERPTVVFFPVAGEPWAFCPLFEAERVRRGAGIERLFPWGEDEGPEPVLSRAMAAMGLGARLLGIEYRYMRVLERELLVGAVTVPLRYADAGPLFAELRSVKDQSELAIMQEAGRLVDAGVLAAHEKIKPGVSEREVAAYIQAEMQRLGASGPLHIFVASGERSGVPHAGTTDRLMQDGELAWVDIVYTHQGYVGDITRTYPVGRVQGELAEIYKVCVEAQRLACEQARPGITGAQLDAVARTHIASKGYGPFFTHRTGHGLGLEGHEEPYIVGSNHTPLTEGMTFTIEPGIYIPGLGGVRIEDDVVMTAAGVRTLTDYPRDLLTQGR